MPSQRKRNKTLLGGFYDTELKNALNEEVVSRRLKSRSALIREMIIAGLLHRGKVLPPSVLKGYQGPIPEGMHAKLGIPNPENPPAILPKPPPPPKKKPRKLKPAA